MTHVGSVPGDPDGVAVSTTDERTAGASGSGQDSTEGPEPEQRRPSQSAELVALAEERYDFAVASTGEPFAVTKPDHGPYVARILRGGRGSLRSELAALYNAANDRVPSASALADARAGSCARASSWSRFSALPPWPRGCRRICECMICATPRPR